MLVDLGMMPIEDPMAKVKPTAYNVLVDGKVVGFVSRNDAPRIVDKLRILKIKKDDNRLEFASSFALDLCCFVLPHLAITLRSVKKLILHLY